MALSDRSKKVLQVGLADRRAGKEVALALDSVLPGTAVPNIAALGALAAVGTAVDPTAALAADVDARIATLQAKLDALLAAMVTNGQMTP